MRDSVRRVVVFFRFFEPSSLARPRGLRAAVVLPPDVVIRDGKICGKGRCYAMLRMRPLSISCAESCVVISCGKVDYDKSSWRDD
jgi:hypothetical protein